MGFKVVGGKVVKTNTPKKNASAKKPNNHAAAQSKAGKGKMTPEEVAAMKARYAAVAANPELGKNPAGRHEGGRRTRRNRKTRRSRR